MNQKTESKKNIQHSMDQKFFWTEIVYYFDPIWKHHNILIFTVDFSGLLIRIKNKKFWILPP